MLRTCLILPVMALYMSALPVNVDAANRNIAYHKRWLQGRPVHVVTVNLNSPSIRISPAISRYGIGSSEGFGSMLSRLQPAAAITGTYFGVHDLMPVGDIVIQGQLVHFGPVGTGLCITPDNRVVFQPTEYARRMDWSGYSSVICSGPRLVQNGKVDINLHAEGFRDPGFYRNTRRTAVGLTKHNKLLLVTVNRSVSLLRMARIMQDLGALDAIQLDGGTSAALYCNGTVFVHPGRRLTNLLLVYDKPDKFDRIKSRLAPRPVMAVTPKTSS